MNRRILCPVALVLCALALCASLASVEGQGGHDAQVEWALPSTAALALAATAAGVAQEKALRRAISVGVASYKPVNFFLTADIVLTAPLPDLNYYRPDPNHSPGEPASPEAQLNITGKCTDRLGRPRRCIIDGAGKHAMLNSPLRCDITVADLVIQNVFGNVHVGQGTFSARNVLFRNNRGPQGPVLDSKQATYIIERTNHFFRCDFVNNTALAGNGGAVNVGQEPLNQITLSFSHCTFRNNRAPRGLGGAVYSSAGTMSLRNSVVVGNSAASGGALALFVAGSFTAIGTTFASNSATNGHGGAVLVDARFVPNNAAFRFCRCSFQNNVARPRLYRSSSNIAFRTDTVYPSVGFCPGPAPNGTLVATRKMLARNCAGCSGCANDCNGHGKCLDDRSHAFPYCSCNAFFDNSSSCTACLEGYTRRSQCTQCSSAYHHPRAKPLTCTLCPGLSAFSRYLRESIVSVSRTIGPLECQRLCKASQQPIRGNAMAYNPNYSNMWIYIGRSRGAPPSCAGKCFLVLQADKCGVGPIKRLPLHAISYQYLDLGLNPAMC